MPKLSPIGWWKLAARRRANGETAVELLDPMDVVTARVLFTKNSPSRIGRAKEVLRLRRHLGRSRVESFYGCERAVDAVIARASYSKANLSSHQRTPISGNRRIEGD